MRKLFTCLYGSNLYGTATPESDRDVKHIVLPDLDALLLGKTIKNEVHKTNKIAFTKNAADDVDEEFIPLQVFARDFLEGQTYALELAFAVEWQGAEQQFYDGQAEDETWNPFLQFCRELREKFLTSSMKAMMGYAVNQAELYSDKGMRLSAARATYDLLSKFHIRFSIADSIGLQRWCKTLAEDYPKHIAVTTYDQDGKGNMQPCLKVLGRVLPYAATIAELMNTVQKIIDRYGDRAKAASIDNVDWKATMHAYRIITEGIMLLKDKRLVFPYPDWLLHHLRLIKEGQLPYEAVKEMIEASMMHLTQLEAESTLPKLTHELRQKQDEWLLGWLKEFYL